MTLGNYRLCEKCWTAASEFLKSLPHSEEASGVAKAVLPAPPFPNIDAERTRKAIEQFRTRNDLTGQERTDLLFGILTGLNERLGEAEEAIGACK